MAKIHTSADVHETAIIHDSAEIAANCTVGPYAYVGENTILGEGTSIGMHAYVEFAHIGKNNRIFHHASVGTAPQDLKYKGEKTLLVMGDNNTVRENCQMNRGTGESQTTIGSNGLYCAFTHIAHDCKIGNHVVLVSFAALAGHVEIGDGSVLSAHVGIHQFVRLGKMVMVSAGAAVGKDVPPFCIAQGDRAVLRGLNVVGLRRSPLPATDVKAIRAAYRSLFLSGQPFDAAIAEIKSSSSEAVQYFAGFIEEARKSRGLTMPIPNSKEPEGVTA
jgi:UDP-N-acetylglucosamine acyltransferase